MDLSTLDIRDAVNEGSVLELRDPQGSPIFEDDGKTPVTITLLGDDADAVTKINNIHANQYMRSGTGGQTVTAEMTLTNLINKLAAATVSWSGIGLDGEDLSCTTENAKLLYRRLPWVRDQVRAFVHDRANFTKPSRKG